MSSGFSRRSVLLEAGAALVVAAVFFALGMTAAGLFGGDDDDSTAVVAITPTTAPSKTVPAPGTPTAAPAATPLPTRSPMAVAPTPTRPAPVAAPRPPTPTHIPTPDFTKQPSIEILAASPSLGTHIELATIDVAIDVAYQGGRDSNVLAWELYYCAGPRDCNTYGSRNETAVVPGAAGAARLGAPFPAGGNYLRPIVVCRYTVVIGHFLTPEAQWQTAMSLDPRCQGGDASASVRITDVTPAIGSTLGDGDVATAYVEYNAYGATQLQVISRGNGCTILGSRTIDVERDSASVASVHVTASPPGQGVLREVDAILLDEGAVKARYSFGGC